MSELFRVKTKWIGGLDGKGDLSFPTIEFPFSVPKSLKGAGVGTNPEELLLGASASCFLLTLGTILNLQKVPVSELRLESEIEVTTEGGLTVKKISHFPKVRLAVGESPENRVKAEQAVAKAETYCLIAKALRGNVTIEVVPAIELVGNA